MAPPPRHADSLAPDYGRGRALRLRASGRPRRATEAAQPRTGTRRAALLGPCARACAPWRYTPSQVVFVSGEAGIGKTSVVEAFLEQVAAEGSVWIGRGQCIEH